MDSGESEKNETQRKPKFIVTKNGDVYFASRGEKRHADIARNNKIPRDEIAGGGTADMVKKRMYGSSGDFGKYNRELVRDSFPDWTLE